MVITLRKGAVWPQWPFLLSSQDLDAHFIPIVPLKHIFIDHYVP